MAATASSQITASDDALQRPTLSSAAECSTAELRQTVQGLAGASMSSAQRFQALETLRARAFELFASEREHYLGKSLPLAEDERATWEGQVGLWQAFYIGYALCTDIGGDVQVTAAVWQRALDSLGRAIREHTRVYRSAPAALWKELNNCYRTAEACGLAAMPLTDEAAAGAERTCGHAFVTTVLHEAANLFACSSAQMSTLEAHLAQWTPLVELRATPPEDASRLPLAIDLCSDSGARLVREPSAGESMRYLEASRLADTLRKLAARLREQPSAAELSGLLRELPRSAVERLLTHLYVQWCSAGSGRVDERRDSTTRAQVAVTMNAIHFQISGRAFRQPGLRYTREEEHDLATFGHITERTEQRLLTGRSAALEPWDIVNQSSSGVLGMIRKSDLASRIGHGQLVAVRTSSANGPSLATVQRLRAESDGSLSVGLRVIRGDVRGVAVRLLGAKTEKYERALVVSEQDKKTQSTLITVRGQFTPGALVEMHATRPETVELGEVVERGHDYERVGFDIA